MTHDNQLLAILILMLPKNQFDLKVISKCLIDLFTFKQIG